ncbi:MAG: hypothetical protein AB1505_12620 [Candidatus Latescibacterota bacterium]
MKHANPEAFRRTAEPAMRDMAGRLARHPEWTLHREVLHADVREDRAIALNQVSLTQPDPPAREVVTTRMQEVVMLAKLRGEWRVTGSIEGIGCEQSTVRLGLE